MHVVLLSSNFGLLAAVALLCLLRLPSGAAARTPGHLHRAHALENRADLPFDLDAARVFPHQPARRDAEGVEERGLLGTLDNILNNVLGISTTPAPTTAQQQTTAAPPPPPASTPEPPAPVLPAPSQVASTGGYTPATTSSHQNTQVKDTTNLPFQTNIVAGSNSDAGRHFITDSNGNLVLPSPITVTWLSTLPDGSISTVVEIYTPGVEVSAQQQSASKAKLIGAVVGAIAGFFVLVFIVAFLFLMLHKRRRRIELTRSRPTSASSFGSVSDEFAHMRERDSAAPLGLGASAAAFGATKNRNSAYSRNVDPFGDPVPPSPLANRYSNAGAVSPTFSSDAIHGEDFPLPPTRIGVYPAADSYTPWAYPPSESEASGVLFSRPTTPEKVYQPASGTSKSKRDSVQPSIVTAENPFKDTATSPPSPTSKSVKSPLTRTLADSALHRGSFGQAIQGSPILQQVIRETTDRESINESRVTSAEYASAVSNRDSDHSLGTHVTHATSDKRYSYHSAFQHSRPSDVDPFTDPIPRMPEPSSSRNPAARPTTAKSLGALSNNSSVMDRAPNMAPSPDASQLFYHPKVEQDDHDDDDRQSRASRLSNSSDGSTVRGVVTYAYPSLLIAASLDNEPRQD